MRSSIELVANNWAAEQFARHQHCASVWSPRHLKNQDTASVGDGIARPPSCAVRRDDQTNLKRSHKDPSIFNHDLNSAASRILLLELRILCSSVVGRVDNEDSVPIWNDQE